MIANERPVIANSLWTATANPAPDCPPLDGTVTAQVAVVGGGYTGLSAALHLAEAGTEVVLLEAQQPGWGASGRNGGQVNPGLKDGPAAMEARFGPDMGRRMTDFSGSAGQLVFDLIDRHGIACDAAPVGWLRAAHDARSLAVLHGLAREWQDRGAAVRALDSRTARDMMGTGAYVGGLLDERGGNLHPLNYALGLAHAARKAGARLYGHSRVTALEPLDGGYRLRTDAGVVEAGQVLLCTNAYTDDLAPPLRRTVVPVRSIQVATEPLSGNLAQSILPGRQAPSDLRRLLLYFRKDARGRFIMGGRGAYSDQRTTRLIADLKSVSVQIFPQLKDVAWQYEWGGFVAVTPDHFPHLHRLGPGLLAALGYNGRGIAMATAMGKLLADWAQGRPDAELDFPVTAPRPLPLHRMHRLGVTATLMKSQLLDRLGL